ncbi:MAG: hypothetical protein HOM96_00025 [Rickettsiales bacterium]|jgi:hypothetical protein|nr:hypothetical protein [Rickettsiales bacterium]
MRAINSDIQPSDNVSIYLQTLGILTTPEEDDIAINTNTIFLGIILPELTTFLDGRLPDKQSQTNAINSFNMLKQNLNSNLNFDLTSLRNNTDILIASLTEKANLSHLQQYCVSNIKHKLDIITNISLTQLIKLGDIDKIKDFFQSCLDISIYPPTIIAAISFPEIAHNKSLEAEDYQSKIKESGFLISALCNNINPEIYSGETLTVFKQELTEIRARLLSERQESDQPYLMQIETNITISLQLIDAITYQDKSKFHEETLTSMGITR